LTERAFVRNLEKAGFGTIQILERRPLNIDDCALYPLFTDELLDLMRALIAPHRQARVATAVVVKARLDA
jgi:hypothetical protein